MPRLFHLFIDILTTGPYHLLCMKDFRGLWPNPLGAFGERFLDPSKARICPGQRGYSSLTEVLIKDNLSFPVSVLSSQSMRDGNVVWNWLALCLHSAIEAFSLTHLLWACPRSTISTEIQPTGLLAEFSLSFLTHCSSLVIFFPDNQTAVCSLLTYSKYIMRDWK